MKTVKFFKHSIGPCFTAIHPEENYFLVVELFKADVSIEKTTGENATNLRFVNCLENQLESNSEEFVDAINAAHKILLDTPYL